MRVEEEEGGVAFEEGEDLMGYLVEGEVFADVPLGGFPHEGVFGGVELNQEGPMALGGSQGGSVGD